MGFFSGIQDTEVGSKIERRGYLHEGTYVLELDTILASTMREDGQPFHVVEFTVFDVLQSTEDSDKVGARVKWFETPKIKLNGERTQGGEYAFKRIRQFYAALFGKRVEDITDTVMEAAEAKGLVGTRDEQGRPVGGDVLKGTLIQAVVKKSAGGYCNPVFIGLTAEEQARIRKAQAA